jgi:hypothetical protein
MLNQFFNFERKQSQQVILSAYYALGFLVLIGLRNKVYEKSLMTMTDGWSYHDFYFLPEKNSLKIIYLLAIFCQLLASLLPRMNVFRVAVAYAWCLLAYSLYSFGHVSHDLFGWLLVNCIFAVPTRLLSSAKMMMVARTFCLSIYFNSGLWKFRGLFHNHVDHWWHDLAYTLPHHLAEVHNGGGVVNLGFLELLLNHYYLSGLSWLAVIAFQLSTVLMLFAPKYDFYWGWLLILFHSSTSFLLDIDFRMNVHLIFFIFLIVPPLSANLSECLGKIAHKNF